jgi:Icc-related predicted phosphoesterase
LIRIAAVGDLHLDDDDRGRFRPAFERLPDHADVLLLAGDLTRHGTEEEGRAIADEVRGLPVPVIAVLGNHDYHSDQQHVLTRQLEDAGVLMLEGRGVVLDVDGRRVGVAGVKGFGGGFPGKHASEFGEPEMKAFIRHTKDVSARLREALLALDCHVRIALTHYAPVRDTLAGEPPEIHPFLGSYHLAEAIDAAPADLAVHGHAHLGSEKGLTSAGVTVRNVAHPVIKRAYAVYCLE